MKAKKILHIDLQRCIACRACEIACAREHHGISHIFVTPLDDHYYVPLFCLQCEKTPCVAVCPTNALEKTALGAVIVHHLRCIGCRLCTIACPLGVIRVGSEATAIKCDFCINRLKQGKEPVCVLTCPTKALIYKTPEQIMQRQRKKGALTSAISSNTSKQKVKR